jgi:hypothetical protein
LIGALDEWRNNLTQTARNGPNSEASGSARLHRHHHLDQPARKRRVQMADSFGFYPARKSANAKGYLFFLSFFLINPEPEDPWT